MCSYIDYDGLDPLNNNWAKWEMCMKYKIFIQKLAVKTISYLNSKKTGSNQNVTHSLYTQNLSDSIIMNNIINNKQEKQLF